MRKVLSRFLLPVLLCISLLPADLVFALDDAQLLSETLLVPPTAVTAQQESDADPSVPQESEPVTEPTEPEPTTAPEAETDPTLPAEDPTEMPELPTEDETTEATEPATADAPAAIRLSRSDVQAGTGETFYLFAQDETNRTVSVSFTVGDSMVLQQTTPGCFTAAASGQTTITARSSDGATADCTVTVFPAPNRIDLAKADMMLGVGETFRIDAKLPAGTFTSALQYETSDSSVLTHVSGDTFRARHSGTAAVTVSAHNGVSAVCTVTVKKAPKALTLAEPVLTLGVGETYRLQPGLPKNTWCSTFTYTSDTKAVTVSADGKLTAKKQGAATVTVTAQNGVSAVCAVTVKKAPKKITIPKSVKLNPGDTYAFAPAVKDGYASHSFTIKSSKKKIAAVSDALTITAKKRGTATVTVTAFNGVSAQSDVQVLPLPKQIRFKKSVYHTQMGKHITPKFVLPEGTCCTRYTFTSSDPYIASIDENGVISCRSIGTATIKAETPNGKTATCSVSVSSIAVPVVSQLPAYPTGCEAASCTALLRYYGYDITLKSMVSAIPRQNIVYKNGRRYGPDINKKFVGNPAGSYTSSTPGYGAFSPVIRKALQKVINRQGGTHTARRISGCSFETLLEYLSEGHPAIVWSTYNMLVPQTVNSWYIPKPDGSARYFQYPRGTHVTVLKGYSRGTVTMMDPYGGNTKTFHRDTFRARWNLLGRQAVVLI